WKPSRDMARALLSDAGNYDLLHVHSLYLFHDLMAPLAARRANRPYLIRPHGLLDPYIRRRHRLRKALVELAYQNRVLAQADAIHYTSADEQRISEPYARGAPGIVVPLGVDAPARLADAVRQPRRILFLSRLHPKKGLDLLVPAFAAVRKRYGDARLVIAGPDDGARAATDDLVARHGLGDCVEFPGMLTGIAKDRAFAEAGLFVLPSYSENFGIAVAEAMAAGLPVVVSDQVNIHDAIAGTEAGLVVPCQTERLAQAMSALLADPDKGIEMGRNGTELVRTRYGWPAIGKQLVDVYRRIIDRRRS
ncbi:MAG: glycosyltransferase, partial [Reyranellaceae bacterium]